MSDIEGFDNVLSSDDIPEGTTFIYDKQGRLLAFPPKGLSPEEFIKWKDRITMKSPSALEI